VFRGDSRVVPQNFPAVELSVFSPPYPNSFDYTDVYNVELWMLGYFRHSDDNRSLRQSTLSSHVQIQRLFPDAPIGSKTLSLTLSHLVQKASELWSPRIPDMIGGYFADMMDVLFRIRNSIHPEGSVWMVVGNSQYAGVNVPVPEILSELCTQVGFSPIKVEPFRSMRSSPQQGGKKELTESILVLEPC